TLMLPHRAKLLCLSVCLAACSSGPGGSGMVNGSILGSPLPVNSSLSYSNRSLTAGSTTVVLGTWGNGCALGPNVNPKNSQALIFAFAQATPGGTGPLSMPAAFPVGTSAPAGSVVVTFVGNDSQCVVTSADTAVSGMVTVTAVSGDEI